MTAKEPLKNTKNNSKNKNEKLPVDIDIAEQMKAEESTIGVKKPESEKKPEKDSLKIKEVDKTNSVINYKLIAKNYEKITTSIEMLTSPEGLTIIDLLDPKSKLGPKQREDKIFSIISYMRPGWNKLMKLMFDDKYILEEEPKIQFGCFLVAYLSVIRFGKK